jgi:phosphoribosylanthranilate isomerase
MIKICGLTDADAVAAAVAAGADAVGFVFAPSVREVSVEVAGEIARQVPDKVLKVAVMLHPEQEHWLKVQEKFRPDVLQTDAADFDYLQVAGNIRRWPVIREGADTTVLPDEFVYEGTQSGQGQTVDWEHAGVLARRGRMILAGGLAADNVQRAILTVRPWGVDVSSAVESAPGRKDPARIREFISAAREAEAGAEVRNEC